VGSLVMGGGRKGGVGKDVDTRRMYISCKMMGVGLQASEHCYCFIDTLRGEAASQLQNCDGPVITHSFPALLLLTILLLLLPHGPPPPPRPAPQAGGL
jgi:hypothetical protein